MDDYLPRETLDWCHQELVSYGIDLDTLSAGDISFDRGAGSDRMHVQAYTYLRTIVRRHIESGNTPILSTCSKPEGGYEAVQAFGGTLQDIIESNADFVRQGEEIEIQLAGEHEHPEQFEEDELANGVWLDI